MVNKVKFDRDNVISLAAQLFWQKGFNATSTRDLQDAINMRPGSIYSTFGSKEGLYSEALKDYSLQMKAQIEDCLAQSDSILDGLQHFVQQVVDESINCTQQAICMLVKANTEFVDKNSHLYGLSVELSAQFEEYLKTVFEQAIENNELTGKLTALEYARFFQVQFTGLRSYLNRPHTEKLAEPMVKQMFALIKSL